MSEIPRPRVDRVVAEQLLRGGRPGGGDVEKLVAVLAAASSPGPGGELPGEEAAVTAFRIARRAAADRQNSRGAVPAAPAAGTPTVPEVSPPRPRRRLVRLRRPVRAGLAAVCAALAVGGVAVAAEGASSGGLFGAHPSANPSASHTGRADNGPLQASAAPSAPTGGSASTAGPGSSAGAAVIALCRGYQHSSGQAAEQAKSQLAAQAGGADKVGAYCAAALSGKPGNGPSPAGSPGSDGNGSEGNGSEGDGNGHSPKADASHPAHGKKATSPATPTAAYSATAPVPDSPHGPRARQGPQALSRRRRPRGGRYVPD